MTGNKGEWSEIYIFLKLMYEGKVYAADRDMNKLDDVFLNIIKIIREEIADHIIDYKTGDIIKIYINGTDTEQEIPKEVFGEKAMVVWDKMNNTRGNISSEFIDDFFADIRITKLKAPAAKQTDFFGGTQDITMEVMDYRSGITSIIGFSCKSENAGNSTLFNASAENTNFIYKITGNIDDDLMNEVNSLFVEKRKKNKDTGEYGPKYEVATGERIRKLKNCGCDVEFVDVVKDNARRNIVLSGGQEMPIILGNMLKHYYWVGEARSEYNSFVSAVEYVIENNVAQYSFDNIESIYKRKASDLLYNMFTGMRLGTSWDGKSSVNGGYIVVKRDGDIVAYHTCIADEFKDFLLNKLGFETPGATRHKFMEVYKENGEYFIKFNLQLRFNN